MEQLLIKTTTNTGEAPKAYPKAFENLLQLSEQILETSLLSISTFKNGCQEFRFNKGLNGENESEFKSFVPLIIDQQEAIIIPNLKEWKGQTLLKKPYTLIQFYCGFPLKNAAEDLIGFFEIADIEPREISQKQLLQFQLISNQIGEVLINEDLIETDASETEQNLLAIFNHAPMAMVIASPVDGMIKMVNFELLKLAETTESEVIGKYTTDFYAIEIDRQLYISKFKETGSVKNFEMGIKRMDGSVADCIVSSEQIIIKGESLILSSFIDISARKKVEILITKNEEKFRSLYNRTPVMLHSLNENGDFISVSDYWLAKLGYQRSQIIGKNISNFFTKASVRESVKFRLPELKLRGYDFDIPYQVIKRNGEVMDVLVSTIVEKPHDDIEIRYFAVMQDVTKRKKNDEALQQSEDNLRSIFENSNIGYALLDADLFIVSFN